MVKHYNLTIKTPKFFLGDEEPLKIENLNIQELIDTTKNKLDELYDIKDFKDCNYADMDEDENGDLYIRVQLEKEDLTQDNN